jgi:hypothetical protein
MAVESEQRRLPLPGEKKLSLDHPSVCRDGAEREFSFVRALGYAGSSRVLECFLGKMMMPAALAL